MGLGLIALTRRAEAHCGRRILDALHREPNEVGRITYTIVSRETLVSGYADAPTAVFAASPAW